jgi:hypothetical protein
MNTNTLKALTVAVAVAGGMGAATSAMATSTTQPVWGGIQVLGPTVNDIDIWTFTCPALFPRGRATVQDVSIPFSIPNKLQVALTQGGLASQKTDNNQPLGLFGGEGLVVSPVAAVNGVAGLSYFAFFKHTTVGAERYVGDLYCTNLLTNIRVNPIIRRLVNQ